MNTMKWILVGAAGVVVVVALVIGAIFLATDPAVDAANTFLNHVGNGRVEQAYKEAAPAFRQRQTLDGFRTAVQRYGMDRYASASWPSREIGGNQALLKGTITLRGGGSLAANVGLVKLDGSWRVYGMTFPPKVPPRAEIETLVTRSLLDFNAAVQKKDFTAFHANLSSAMQQKYTAEQVQGVFHKFITEGINLAPIEGVTPEFEPGPKLNDRGALEVKGHYPTKPSQVMFDLRFVRERGAWRIITINVQVRPVS